MVLLQEILNCHLKVGNYGIVVNSINKIFVDIDKNIVDNIS